jgi:hypothetical protein
VAADGVDNAGVDGVGVGGGVDGAWLVSPTGGRVSPTWRMVPGECRESLALQTATDMGVSNAVVRRSGELLAQLHLERCGGGGKGEVDGSIPGGGGGGGGGGSRESGEGGSSVSLTSAPPLEALRDLLRDVARTTIPAFSAALGTRDTALHAFDLDALVGTVRAAEVPPPAASAWTCVYVLLRSDGWVYCGETDNLAGRLEAHRATALREYNASVVKNNGGGGGNYGDGNYVSGVIGGGDGNHDNDLLAVALGEAYDAGGGAAAHVIDVEVAFLAVPREVGGKSAARALESRVIKKLRAEGVPLLSGMDARNTSFGSASAT